MPNIDQPLILHIIDELPPDGAERLLVDLLQYRSDKFRYEVLCLIGEGRLKQEIEAAGVPVKLLKRGSKWDLGYLFKLRRYIKQLSPYAVHTHLFTADAWGRLAAYLAGVDKIFSTIHSTNDWMSSVHIQVDKILSKVSTALIACSDKVATQLINDRKLAPEKVKLIPNGVAIDRFEQHQPLDLYETFGISPDLPTMALIGRLHEAKGHLFILPILKKLKTDGFKFNFLIVGEGSLEQQIKDQIDALDLNDCVTLTGFREDIPSIIHSIDFLIMPSRWEGLPITLLEAMAGKAAVIASTVGGIPTVLEGGSAGILVDPDDESTWYDSIAKLINDQLLRDSLAEIAYNRVTAYYSARSVQNRYEQLYLGQDIET